MSDVRLEDVSKVFKDTIAVDRLTFGVESGEFFSLLGPSGCGKTTTLRMIGGFEQPTAGRISIGGNDVTDLPPHRRSVNTVFQSYALFPHLNVYENVAYGLKRRKAGGGDIDRRVTDMLELVDLEGFGKRRTNQLSGGQQQRVALARALVNHPEVLLLDEPLGALDLKLRKQMQLELKRIQSEVGITFVYVTHDQEEAMTMSDRIGVMNQGRIEQLGAPQQVYEAPGTAFVAAFLGASNLLPGEIERVDADLASIRLDAGATVRIAADRLPFQSGHIHIGVRPEKIKIVGAEVPLADGRNSVDALVVMSTYTGVSTQYECRTGDGHSVVVYVQNLEAGAAPAPAGAKVRLEWDADHTFAVALEKEGAK